MFSRSKTVVTLLGIIPVVLVLSSVWAYGIGDLLLTTSPENAARAAQQKLWFVIAATMISALAVLVALAVLCLAERQPPYTNDQLLKILDLSPMGVNIVTLDGERLFTNHQLTEITGYQMDELPHGSFRDTYADPTERDRVMAEFQRTGKLDAYEVEMIRKDGLHYWARMSLRMIETQSGQAMLGWLDDISAQKRAQDEAYSARYDLELVNQELESRVQRRTKQLSEAVASAEQANRAKSQFLANMSHEIRTPMNGVVGMVDILRQTELETEQHRMVRTIRNSAFALLRIVDDILDASKIEAGQLSLENIAFRLGGVVEGAVSSVVPLADENQVRVQLHYDPNLPKWIQSDPVRLRQIFMNLMSNAIKFSRPDEEGGVGRVLFRIQACKGNAMRVTVSDNGIGMSQEMIEVLFRPFTQAEQSTTREFGGTGLGMTITDSLVRMMGGGIEVESTPGEGTSFIVTLPLTAAEGRDLEPDLSGLTVIGIADEHLSRDQMVAYIEHAGASVHFADTDDDVERLLNEIKCETVVFLAKGSNDENDKLRQRLLTRPEKPLILQFTSNRSDRLGLVEKNVYVTQRHPVLPSEFLTGIAILAGREESTEEETGPELGTEEQKQAASSLKVLLVEDNETNQDVISRQLRLLGYGVEIARDGREGLGMWRDGGFDLILTDVHMPVMDGFEMTDQIRREERQGTGDRIVIIAITANALRGEAERCLASGMDDYLAKPVEFVRLSQVLRPWSMSLSKEKEKEKEAHSDGLELTEQAPSNGTTSVDPEAMALIFGVNDPELFAAMLTSFVERAVPDIEGLAEALRAEQNSDVVMFAHKLKSSSRTVGANVLAELCATLEQDANGRILDDCPGLAEQVELEFRNVENFVREYVKS